MVRLLIRVVVTVGVGFDAGCELPGLGRCDVVVLVGGGGGDVVVVGGGDVVVVVVVVVVGGGATVTSNGPVPVAGPMVLGAPMPEVVCWVLMVMLYWPPAVGVGIGNTATLSSGFGESYEPLKLYPPGPVTEAVKGRATPPPPWVASLVWT